MLGLGKALKQSLKSNDAAAAKNARAAYTDPGERSIKSLDAHVHVLGEDDVGPEVKRVRELLLEKRQTSQSPADWARWGFVLDKIRGAESVLDVGAAYGRFLNAIALGNFAKRITGIDIHDRSRHSRFSSDYEFLAADVSNMPFQDNEFDVVTCMEVIEHLTDDKLDKAISELRRVARKHLIISVPFCEPLPLPEYHHQQFMPERVRRLFPDAAYTMLIKTPVSRVPWLIVEEHYQK